MGIGLDHGTLKLTINDVFVGEIADVVAILWLEESRAGWFGDKTTELVIQVESGKIERLPHLRRRYGWLQFSRSSRTSVLYTHSSNLFILITPERLGHGFCRFFLSRIFKIIDIPLHPHPKVVVSANGRGYSYGFDPQVIATKSMNSYAQNSSLT